MINKTKERIEAYLAELALSMLLVFMLFIFDRHWFTDFLATWLLIIMLFKGLLVILTNGEIMEWIAQSK